jgi:hypothetical protein
MPPSDGSGIRFRLASLARPIGQACPRSGDAFDTKA